MPTIVSRITAPMAHHHLLTKPDMASSMRVGSGSFALSDAKNVRNFGQDEGGQNDDRHDRHDSTRPPG